jgi:hypothetical protein
MTDFKAIGALDRLGEILGAGQALLEERRRPGGSPAC